MAKVLIVEDNEANRDALSRRLMRRGFEVITASDGQEGVAVAQAEKPDLILMDMNMPVLDGWEATRQIKASAEIGAVPVIGRTAPRDGGRPRACVAGGLHRLPHQAGGVRETPGPDQGAPPSASRCLKVTVGCGCRPQNRATRSE